MKILCLVKLVPDVENFRYDFEKNVLVRENVHQVLNPEDATALTAALAVREEFPGIRIETVTMAPRSAIAHLEDLVRRGVDRATLISDPLFVGSDTYGTSRILSRYIETQSYDAIFTGTHSLDGGTAHVPAQIAQMLDLPQMSQIVEIDGDSFGNGFAVIDVDSEDAVCTFEIDLPAVLSFAYSTKRKLPYISYENLHQEVRDRVHIVTNEALGFERHEVGLEGSLTRVTGVEIQTFARKDTLFVLPDDEGIEQVYAFLVRKGFIRL